MRSVVQAQSRSADSDACYADGLKRNGLLALLSPVERSRLAVHLDLVSLSRGEVICAPGQQLLYGFFPTSAIVSLQNTCESGETSETAVVGPEGLLGVALFMGGSAASTTAVVQTAGYAYRIHHSHLQEAFERDWQLRRVLLRYTRALLAQTAQLAVCNRYHTLEQQVCRWFLSTLDRVSSKQLTVTHDWVANALGVRREGVTVTAGNLQRAGFIRYHRGQVEVLRREGLEAHACECYAVVKRELHGLQPNVRSVQAA